MTAPAPKVRCYGSGRVLDDMYVNPSDWTDPVRCPVCDSERIPRISTYQIVRGDPTTAAYKVTFPYHTRVERWPIKGS